MGKPDKNPDEVRKRRLANLRPPFKKGNKGGGRPEGTRNFKSILKDYLKLKANSFDKIQRSDQRVIELMASRSIHRAIKRGGFDLKEILDRTEGPVVGDISSNPIAAAFMKMYPGAKKDE